MIVNVDLVKVSGKRYFSIPKEAVRDFEFAEISHKKIRFFKKRDKGLVRLHRNLIVDKVLISAYIVAWIFAHGKNITISGVLEDDTLTFSGADLESESARQALSIERQIQRSFYGYVK